MTLEELEEVNRATLKALGEGKRVSSVTLYPYYGFYEVKLFECPPFLMFTANDCPRGWNILYDRYFEPSSMKLWCRLAPLATGILDIGSHVGVYSLAAAGIRPDLDIHAFEPNPMAFSRLRIHKLINGFDNIIEQWFAVGDKKEIVPFAWAKKETLQISSGASVGKRKGEQVERVLAQMSPLDGTGIAETLGDKPLVKIDVEGGEIRAFRGLQEVLALKPDIIMETFSQKACDQINPMIKAFGLRVYLIREKLGVLEERDELRPCDALGEDYNQFLTARPKSDIAALML